MRVLHVITALGVGGAERMLLKLLSARALSGVEQRVVAMLPGGAMAEPMRVARAKVDELDFLGGVPVLSGVLGLRRLARQCSPDVVQGWLYHGNLGAALARSALGRRVPLVWGVRQSLPTLKGENALARIGIHLNKVASGMPDRLLFNSRMSIDQHRALGFNMAHAHYLPNGFDTAAFALDAAARGRWRATWGADADTVVFGQLARYHPAKDHAGFVLAARQVIELRRQARFVLAGTGVDGENTALAAAIADAGMGRHMHLLGERRDAAALLSGLDVYVSSSAHEAFSNSVGEAMSCALPCVVTQVGDSPHVVGESGRVVPARDPAALAGAMIELIDIGPQGRKALGDMARQRVMSQFDIEAVAQRYRDLYVELTDNNRHPN